MKTSQIFLFALFCCSLALAQTNTFPTSGDVGIGTTSPTDKLHIQEGNLKIFGYNTSRYLRFTEANLQGAFINYDGTSNILNIGVNNINSTDLVNDRNSISIVRSTGNVGIGTTSPSAPLHINNGNDSYGAILANADESSFSLYTKTLGTQPGNIESFRIGLKYGLDENNGYISFYRGGNTDGGFLGLATNGLERVRISDNGNVGIGTANPSANLQVMGGIGINTGVAGNLGSGGSLAIGDGDTGLKQQGDGILSIYTNNVERMRISPGQGNVGIGTTNPSSKLDISGSVGTMSKIHLTNASVGSDGGYFDINMGTNDLWAAGLKAYVPTGQPGLDRVYLGLYTTTFEGSLQSRIERMTITDRGNVGIGTTIPDDKLTVKGRIHAEEVKVDLSVPGPDYVFKEGYDLKSLKEVRNYIKEKGHLPNIPSAQEMEENGVELGVMNMKLLEKIEELTLYQLQLLERLEASHTEIEKLKMRVEHLEGK